MSSIRSARSTGGDRRGPVSVLTTSASLQDGTEDLQVFAFEPGLPGAPTGLVRGPPSRKPLAKSPWTGAGTRSATPSTSLPRDSRQPWWDFCAAPS